MKQFGLCLILLLAATPSFAQKTISRPVFGAHTAGDDYFLANYTQLLDYWNKVVKESDRMKLEDIGKTAEGRPIVMAIITSPANFKNLARYKEISQRLARAEGLTDDQAHALAAEGRAVVWIDGGLHANEVVNAQALFTETYDFLSRNDPEMLRILNDDILLLVPINPDGMELVSNWYMRNRRPERANHGTPAAPLSKIRGPRRQSRFVHRQSAGNRGRQPPDVRRVDSADHVQPAPGRSPRARCCSSRPFAIPSTTIRTLWCRSASISFPPPCMSASSPKANPAR